MKRFYLLMTALVIAIAVSAEIKYVFYFIGDGMGANQVMGAEMYRSALNGQPLGRVQTLMTTFPYSGHASSYSKSNGITDSAAAGTCLATGSKTTNGALGVDEHGERLKTIAEELKSEGWGIGIMTTVGSTTPHRVRSTRMYPTATSTIRSACSWRRAISTSSAAPVFIIRRARKTIRT